VLAEAAGDLARRIGDDPDVGQSVLFRGEVRSPDDPRAKSPGKAADLRFICIGRGLAADEFRKENYVLLIEAAFEAPKQPSGSRYC
jgi:hypothetical protein